MPICLVRGDITRFAADAIVNAANPELKPGGGVSGAIHHAAGPSLAMECDLVSRWHGILSPGEAVATGSGDIVGARRVIHAVGPLWRGGTHDEPETLANAYRSSVEAADELGLRTIAFPSLSTGIYGYPVELATPIAVRSVRAALSHATSVHDATFVLIDAETYAVFERALADQPRDDTAVARPGK